MANAKISTLASGSPAQSTDLIPIARNGVTYCLQVSDIVASGTTFLPLAGGTMTGQIVLQQGGAGLADSTGSTGSSGDALIVNSFGNPVWTSQSGGGGDITTVSNSDGTLTISPTTGAVVASLSLGRFVALGWFFN